MPPNKLRKTLSEQKMCSKQISSGTDATFDCALQDAGASGLEHNSFKRTYEPFSIKLGARHIHEETR